MELDDAVAAADLNTSIDILRGVSSLLTLLNQTTEAASINIAADSLETLRDVVLVEVATQLVSVSPDCGDYSTHTHTHTHHTHTPHPPPHTTHTTHTQDELQSTLERVNAAAMTLQQNITQVATDIGSLISNISGPILNTFINEVRLVQ